MNIGITQRVDKIESYGEWRDSIDQRLVQWVVEAGFNPVLIPNSLVNTAHATTKQPLLEKWIKSMDISALLLSGGNSIGEVADRDMTENFLLAWAEKYKIPTLGICRGMQMMGVYAGGELVQISNHIGVHHDIKTKCESQSFPMSVNSYHAQALKYCPDSFNVLAISNDGVIEAIEHKELSWEAWMWHPEREDVFSKSSMDRFKRIMINEEK
jgi:putative glutamine amidotransferase